MSQTVIFNDEIGEQQWQPTDQKTWEKLKIFFRQAHRDQRKAVTTAGKGGYTTEVQNIYGVPPPTSEEYHKVIDHINTIVQGMQMQSHELKGLAQANAVLTISNTAVMAQLSYMNVTMNAIQEHLKTLTLEPTNQMRSKRKYYCWSFGSNYTHRSKTCSSKKFGHQDQAYYKKRLGGIEKECK